MAEKTTLAAPGEDMDTILSYLQGYRSMLVISAACQMELFDKVNQSPGGATAAKLAQENGWKEDGTHRLLNTCVALKLLQKSNEDGKNIFRLAGPGKYLQKTSDPTVWDMTTSWAKKMLEALSKLPEEIRVTDSETGHTTEDQGRPKGATEREGEGEGHSQGHEAQHSEEVITRLRAMGSFIKPYLKSLLEAFDLSKFTSAVDLGAGSGALTFELCRVYPTMSVIYFEKEEWASLVEKHLVPKDANLKITFATGDFFEAVLPAADLYILPRNTYNYDKSQLTALMKKAFDATNSGGAVLLLVKSLNDTMDGPSAAHVWDLTIMSHCGGRVRSSAEYTALLQAAGYNDVKMAVTPDVYPYDVFTATKS